jgi:hypothetical protein
LHLLVRGSDFGHPVTGRYSGPYASLNTTLTTFRASSAINDFLSVNMVGLPNELDVSTLPPDLTSFLQVMTVVQPAKPTGAHYPHVFAFERLRRSLRLEVLRNDGSGTVHTPEFLFVVNAANYSTTEQALLQRLRSPGRTFVSLVPYVWPVKCTYTFDPEKEGAYGSL